MKSKKGFISTSIIYAFFLVFILLMIATIMSFANQRFLNKKIINDCEYPGEDIIISCKEGDKLSDCLFVAEYIESKTLNEKKEEESLTLAEQIHHSAVRFVSDNSVDLSLSKDKIIEQIKTKIFQKPDADPNYELGMYKYSDDLGDTYYYRGAEDDNYILFADKLWSIVRVNGDGSIRLVYQGDWDKINLKNDANEKKSYIKNYGYIDMDKNGSKTSNDARHYNVNNIGETLGNFDEFMYAFNHDLITKYCNDQNTNIPKSLKTFIEKKSCPFFKTYSDKKLKDILNFGNVDYEGSKKLYNAGFMSNSKIAWGDTQAKLSNSAPSTILSMIGAWYKSNMEDYEDFINKEALFCANKDVVLEENSDYFLDDDHCYCYGNTKGNYGWNNNIIKLDKNLFTYCSNALGTGYCAKNNYGNGLQLNYHLRTSIEITRNSLTYGLRCIELNNSSFSVNMVNTTKIDYPIGLLTATELILAGASYREANDKFYLATNYNYWTGDLAFGNNNTAYDLNTYYFAYIGNKNMGDSTLNTKNHVLDVLGDKNYVAHIKPVINLKADVRYKKGNGSIQTPYEIGDLYE